MAQLTQAMLFPEPAESVSARLDSTIVCLLFGTPGGRFEVALDGDERAVLAAIRFHRGRDNAININAIQQRTHLNGRAIKKAVRGLRLNYFLPIGSSKHSAEGGYFLMLTPEDRAVWSTDVLDQVRAELSVLRAAAGHQAGLELLGQLRQEFLSPDQAIYHTAGTGEPTAASEAAHG